MSDKKVCRNCGKEFDPNETREKDECRYHPEKSVHVGTADSRYDYSEVYKHPCCDQLEFPESSSASPALGCVQGTHAARD